MTTVRKTTATATATSVRVMHTILATNNAYDTVLLVDEDDVVVSCWQTTPAIISSYVGDTDADLWDAGHTFDPSGEVHPAISDYGEEVGRDGDLGSRAGFYGYVRVIHLDGLVEMLHASTPIYVESCERRHRARSDDGSIASVEDLVPAGTLGDPDSWAGGTDVASAAWYIEDVSTGICTQISSVEYPR